MYDQIDNLIKASRPRRSKSTGRVAVEKLMASPHQSETSLNSGSGHSRNRGSIGDGKAIPGFSVDQRSGSRTSVDNSSTTHKRAESAASGCSESLNNSSVELEVRFLALVAQDVDVLISIFQERMLNDEFDELMRSGTTMKVSLTPDRLKTMEVRSPSPDTGLVLTLASGIQGREKPPRGSQKLKQTRGRIVPSGKTVYRQPPANAETGRCYCGRRRGYNNYPCF